MTDYPKIILYLENFEGDTKEYPLEIIPQEWAVYSPQMQGEILDGMIAQAEQEMPSETFIDWFWRVQIPEYFEPVETDKKFDKRLNLIFKHGDD